MDNFVILFTVFEPFNKCLVARLKSKIYVFKKCLSAAALEKSHFHRFMKVMGFVENYIRLFI